MSGYILYVDILLLQLTCLSRSGEVIANLLGGGDIEEIRLGDTALTGDWV